MRGKKLWAQFWTDRQKSPKRNNCIEGLNFLSSYTMTNPENVLKELQHGLRMTIAGKWGSGYVVILPNTSREELMRNRLATHPFKLSEWSEHEIDGLPNRRYSIFIYDEQTCPQFAKLAETDWRMEYSEGIPIYEKGFNVAFLKRTFPKLIRILKSIYQGGTPQPTVLKTITTESKTRKYMKQNMKTINESQLRKIIAESITKAINELDYKTYINAGKKTGKGGDISAQRELNPNGTPAQWFQDAVKARKRAEKFYDKAREEFNQTHGYKNGRRYDDDYSAVELGGDFTSSEEFGPHIRGFKSKGYGEPYKYEYGRRYDGNAGKDMSPEEFFDGNGDASNAFNNAQEEWANFKQGKYDYDNEKGWHLKESQLKNIIGKAVREALHR